MGFGLKGLVSIEDKKETPELSLCLDTAQMPPVARREPSLETRSANPLVLDF